MSGRIDTPRLWLPRTGQTTSYAVGDDGYFQPGNPRKTRFVDNGNGTISDRATGLMWVQDPSQCGGNFGSPGTPATMTWANALAECLGLTWPVGGFADWRLPNVQEMAALMDMELTNLFSAALFPNTKTNTYYWTSTTRKAATAQAAIVQYSVYQMINGGAKTDPYYVRPVRGGRINANW